MNEEEKEAIEYWKRDIALYHYNAQLCSEHYAQIILNLIEKQEKELNKLKKQAEITAKAHIELTENQDATIEKQEKVIDEIKNRLEEHIKFCKREKNSTVNNDICYISLGFNEKLLDIINRKVEK